MKYITTPTWYEKETQNPKNRRKKLSIKSVQESAHFQSTGKNQSTKKERLVGGGLMSINVCLLCY